MRKRFRSVTAILLSVITVFLLFSPVAGAVTYELPIVYVLGKVDVIYEDMDKAADDESNKVLYPVSIDDVAQTAPEKLRSILAAYGVAFAKEYIVDSATEKEKLDAWEAYGLELYGLLGDIFDDIALDETGHPKDNSGIIWDWNINYRKGTGENILKNTLSDGQYGLYDYTFHYDWRLDMYENAKLLDAYIDDVLEATGRDRCVLISRCYGCNLVGAYFDRYGSEKVATNILYCSTAEGTVVCGEMFSGRFHLSPEGMATYMDELLFGEGSGLLSDVILSNAKSNLNENSFNTTAAIVNKIYSRISDVVMPKTLINSFASMPGYWSLVNNEFEEAKTFVFGEIDSENYNAHKRLINKIDYYHYSVTVNAKDIFIDAKENHDTNYANIVKFGTQIAPMVESSNVLGDGIVEVPSASFGALSGNVGETFSFEYLENAYNNGTLKYINDESTIDASTCIYPDYTWFAEDVEHFDFPQSVDQLLLTISRFKGQMTINDYKRFPQYRKYEGEGNIATWAGGLYLNNSKDSIAKSINDILEKSNGILLLLKIILAFLLVKR